MKLGIQLVLGAITGYLVDRYGYSYSDSPALFIMQLIPLCVVISIAVYLLTSENQKS